VIDKPERKNRRGQRARQAIWEKKFGSRAKHVQQQNKLERSTSNSRPRRRDATSNDYVPPPLPKQPSEATPLHPSWEAKKQQKAKLVNGGVGKKIVF